MVGAIILGLVAGFVAKALVPGKHPGDFFVTILLGLVGSIVGFLIFTELLGIGDNDIFELGGLIGAIIGTVLLLLAYHRFCWRPGGECGLAGASAAPAGGEGHLAVRAPCERHHVASLAEAIDDQHEVVDAVGRHRALG